jgi:hypothetical protein
MNTPLPAGSDIDGNLKNWATSSNRLESIASKIF